MGGQWFFVYRFGAIFRGNTAAEPPQNPPWYYEQGRLCPVSMKLIRDAKKALAVPGSYLDVFTALMCTQLQIRYEKLSEQERTVLKNVMKKTPAYKDSPLSRMKRR